MSQETQILIGIAWADIILNNLWFFIVCSIPIVASIVLAIWIIKTWR